MNAWIFSIAIAIGIFPYSYAMEPPLLLDSEHYIYYRVNRKKYDLIRELLHIAGHRQCLIDPKYVAYLRLLLNDQKKADDNLE